MCICSCIPAFLHVENVARIDQATEVEEVEEVYQEEEQQLEFEVADPVEEQFPESNFANTDLQQGKHRFISNPMSYYSL